MKNWKRTLFIGFIWGCIFIGWWVNGFLIRNWNFNLFHLNDWLFIVDEFRKGWVISASSDWVFFIVLFASIPLYLAGWRCALNIKWLEEMRKNVNRIIYFFTGSQNPVKRPGKIQLQQNSAKKTRPPAMDSSVIRPVMKESEIKVPIDNIAAGASRPTADPFAPASGGYSNPTSTSFGTTGASNYGFGNESRNPGNNPFGTSPASHFSVPSDSPFNKTFSSPSMQQGFSIAPSPLDDKNDFDNMLLEDIKIPERVKLEEDIPSLFMAAGYKLIQNTQLEGQPIDYIAIGKNRIVVCLIDPESGDWLADEERFNGEDPLWFSESSHRVSPIFRLLEQVKPFMERLSGAGFSGTVMPMFIEKKGMIINAEDMLSTWKELSVVVCRTDLGGPDELKSVEHSVITDEAPSEEIIAMVHSAL